MYKSITENQKYLRKTELLLCRKRSTLQQEAVAQHLQRSAFATCVRAFGTREIHLIHNF